MSLTAIELCSAALVKIGSRPITSFTDASAEADVANRLYEITRDALLSAHPWSFTLAQQEVAAEAAAPTADFDHAFTLPGDCLRVLSAGIPGSSRGLTYRVQGQKLLADVDRITVSYQRRADEADMPPFFVAALVARLAAELCLPLTEGTSRSEALHQLAASELRLARLIDSQQSTPRQVEDFTLIGARLQ
jgi:hypothetical protein